MSKTRTGRICAMVERDLVIGTAGHIDHGKTPWSGADRRRHRPAAGRETARDHDRPGLRGPGPRPPPPGDRRRAGPRAVHPEHARRRDGARPGHAGRRGRRLGDAPDPRAPGDPPAPRALRRAGRHHQVRPGRAVVARPRRGGRPGPRRRTFLEGAPDRPDLGDDRARASTSSARPAERSATTAPARPTRAVPDGRSTARSPWPVTGRSSRGRSRRGGRRRRRAGVASRRPDRPRPRAPPPRPARRIDRPRRPGGDQPGRRPSCRDRPRARAGRARAI